MRLWTDRVVPWLTDRALRGPEIDALRSEACAGLTGRVIEIGFGSGLNLPLLPPEVTSVCAIEPSDLGWQLSSRSRERSPVAVERGGLDGQRLAAPNESFDSALITFSLCTIPDAAAALAEVRRVLVSGGTLHFLEHGLAPEPGVVRWQRRLEPIQSAVFAGCHLTRDAPTLISEAGFDLVRVRQDYLPGPRIGRPWGYGSVGTARRISGDWPSA